MGEALKLSYATLATPELDAVQAIRVAREFGFSGVDLRLSSNGGEIPEEPTVGFLREIRNVANAEGIKLPCLLCYPPSDSNRDFSGKELELHLQSQMEIASELGAEAIRVLPLQGDSDVLMKFRKMISKTVHNTSSVKILIQNHWSGINAAACVDLVRQIDHERVKWFCSPEHSLIMGEDLSPILEKESEAMGSVFYSDIVLETGGYRDVLPGEGEVNWREFFRLLEKSSTATWISFKWERVWRKELVGYRESLPFFLKYYDEVRKVS